ncbi:hypothetical protein [Pseudomonas veronii]
MISMSFSSGLMAVTPGCEKQPWVSGPIQGSSISTHGPGLKPVDPHQATPHDLPRMSALMGIEPVFQTLVDPATCWNPYLDRRWRH